MDNQKLKIGRLEIIVFVAGTVVMILELIGSRLIAPFLGTSIFIWTALIGIILGALSLGYYLGGRFSKTNPTFAFLAKILLLAGLAILLITIIKEPVLIYSSRLGVKLGGVAATLALFALPSVLLGIVSPYALRLKVQNIEGSGGVAGNLYALSTIGSIFGTFLAGFYLIPAFGSSQILFGLSLVLVVTSMLSGKKLFKMLTIFLVIVLSLVSQNLPKAYVFEADSSYNHIRVLDAVTKTTNDRLRILYLATEAHTIVYRDSDELFSAYHQLYLLDRLFKPKIEKALTLGGGGYVAPLDFLKRFPQALMTVVEIDPQVTQVARDYFKLKDDPRLKIYHEDGRIFLNNNQEKYDVIYGDAFASYFSVPFQLTTKEAVEKIYNSLVPDGILILNVISSLAGEKSLFFQAEYKTLSQYFNQIYVFPAHDYSQDNINQHQNLILIATKDKDRLTKQDLLNQATEEQKELIKHFWEPDIVIDPRIKVLTDELAPVDYYISKLL